VHVLTFILIEEVVFSTVFFVLQHQSWEKEHLIRAQDTHNIVEKNRWVVLNMEKQNGLKLPSMKGCSPLRLLEGVSLGEETAWAGGSIIISKE
jgi:hypothetical protein